MLIEEKNYIDSRAVYGSLKTRINQKIRLSQPIAPTRKADRDGQG
jgi:hypothetical protein